jgi:hypothetical protein
MAILAALLLALLIFSGCTNISPPDNPPHPPYSFLANESENGADMPPPPPSS